jgi:hypothetical protein
MSEATVKVKSLSYDDLEQIIAKNGGNLQGVDYNFGATAIYTNPLLVEMKEELVIKELDWWDRWVEPMIHPVLLPFEPWVKTREELVTRTIPMNAIFQLDGAWIMHPAMKGKLLTLLNSKSDPEVNP